MPDASENQLEQLIRVFNEVNSEGTFGANAVVRRIKNVVLSEIKKTQDGTELNQESLRQIGLESDLYFDPCDLRRRISSSRHTAI